MCQASAEASGEAREFIAAAWRLARRAGVMTASNVDPSGEGNLYGGPGEAFPPGIDRLADRRAERQQAAMVLVTLSEPHQPEAIRDQASQLLLNANALNALPEPTLFRLAKTSESPLSQDARQIRNERLIPLYRQWLAADEKLPEVLQTAILTVAEAYPLHSAPSGFAADKLAILCSFAGDVYPGIQGDIRDAAADYLAAALKTVPFFALWGLVLNLSDRKGDPEISAGPVVENEALERLLERGEVPEEIAMPWEQKNPGTPGLDLPRLAANELCARLLVERERLPRETAFLFLGRRASILTATVMATTVLPVVWPKLSSRQRMGLIGALVLAGFVHTVLVPALGQVANQLSDNKYFSKVGECASRWKDAVKTRQARAAEQTRDALFGDHTDQASQTERTESAPKG
jgi:hypothetical protein